MVELCSLEQLQTSLTLGFEVEGQKLFAVYLDGQCKVYKNLCPHLNIPLEYLPDQFLDREQQYIMCANHGALFRIEDGMCILGPCRGESLQPFPFEKRDGAVWVQIEEVD